MKFDRFYTDSSGIMRDAVTHKVLPQEAQERIHTANGLRPVAELRHARPISFEKDPRFDRTLTVLDHQGNVIGYIDTIQARVVADWLEGLDK